jgi:hypothetical protein
MATEIGQNGQPKYFCVSCNYKSSHKGHYDRHIMTSKHLNSNKSTDNGQKRTKKDKKDNTIISVVVAIKYIAIEVDYGVIKKNVKPPKKKRSWWSSETLLGF